MTNPKRLAHQVQSQWRWHVDQGMEQNLTSTSHTHWFELENGSWVEETIASPPRPPSRPRCWASQKRLWQRFLTKLAVNDFQINLQQQNLFLCAPTPRKITTQLEWTFSWTLPNRGLGTLLSSLSFRAALPPTSFLMDYFQTLKEVPVLQLKPLDHTPIHFNGYLLIHFLRGAYSHLQQHTTSLGSWQRSPRQPSVNLDTIPKPLDPVDADLPNALPNPLLPQTLRFSPTTYTQHRAEPWHALHYDGDHHHLVCYKTAYPEIQFAKFQLPMPLYKLFSQFTFLPTSKSMVVRNRNITLPDAYLNTEQAQQQSG